jgi:predicted KAP-like P-loop ATPase
MARKKDPKYKKIDLINKIVEMSCSGVSQPEILVWLKNEGECQLSYSYELLREAKPIILETLKDISKDRLETTIRELEQMKMEAKLSGDKKLAIEIQKEINKISGLHNQKIDVTTNGESINQISVIKMIEVKKEDDDNEIEG